MKKKSAKTKAVKFVAKLFERNGYVRYSKREEKSDEEKKCYRKGDEVRLCATSEQEFEVLTQSLVSLGIQFGKPYGQFKQIRVPIYGKQRVRDFLQLVSPYISTINE